ncbi:MAG: hypothetical protein R3F34_20645 [Planctomycetota bacterium]
MSQNHDRSTASAVYPSGRTRLASRVLLPIAAIVAACTTVPITGRQAFIPFPVEQDTPLGEEAYTEVLQTEKPITSGPQAALVKKVMQRLVDAAKSADFDPGFDWQVTLLTRPTSRTRSVCPAARWRSTRASSRSRRTNPGSPS